MPARTSRVDRLMALLSAQQRVSLVVRACKEDLPPDRRLLDTMPARQLEEFNRLIALVRSANDQVATFMLVIEQEVAKLEIKLAWLLSVMSWQAQSEDFVHRILAMNKFAVTESDHARMIADARARWLPVHELAELLACQESKDTDEVLADPDLAARCAHHRRELARLTKRGLLRGRQAKGGLQLEAGSFYDWLGEPVPLGLPFGVEVEVLPDEQTEVARRLNAERQSIGNEFLSSRLLASFAWGQPVATEDSLPALGAQAGLLRDDIRREVLQNWWEARSIRLMWEDIAIDLDGEHPVHAELHLMLEGVEARLKRLAVCEFLELEQDELEEPSEEFVNRRRAQFMDEEA